MDVTGSGEFNLVANVSLLFNNIESPDSFMEGILDYRSKIRRFDFYAYDSGVYLPHKTTVLEVSESQLLVWSNSNVKIIAMMITVPLSPDNYHKDLHNNKTVTSITVRILLPLQETFNNRSIRTY